ncbi:6-phosphogluconate dehydrogenase [bacterium]|nr:6-phosphogluconate dehydrogenase [bacterium]
MKRILIISGIVAFLVAVLAFTLAYNLNYSKGYRSGTIVKLSHKGTIFKTYEGQLLSGGLATGEGGDISSNLWNFSVEKDEKQVLEDIEKAVDGRYPVKLRYNEKYYTFFWRGDTKYFIYEVVKVGQEGK